MYCTICLDNNSRLYHNICNTCNNSICSDCYNQEDIHNLRTCPACRNTLHKSYKIDLKVVLFFISFYRHLFIHIIVNILYTNITFHYKFPTSHISNIVPDDKTAFFMLLNYCNFIIVPLIYNSFKDYTFLNYPYSFLNFVLCLIISHLKGKDLGNMYSLYCILYIYTFCIIHFTFINVLYLTKLFNFKKRQFIKQSNMHKLIIYKSYQDTQI